MAGFFNKFFEEGVGGLRGESQPQEQNVYTSPTREIVAIELMGRCNHCGSPMPVNYPAQTITCSACDKDNILTEQFWEPPLRSVYDIETQLWYDETISGRSDTINHFVEWNSHRAHYPCPECKNETTLSDDAAGLSCTACAWQGSVQKAPPWLSQISDSVAGFISEAPLPGEKQRKKVVSTFKCVNCAASITIDGSDRTVECAFCATTNILPDHIWSVFHPPSVKKRWWIVSRLTMDPRRDLRPLPQKPLFKEFHDKTLKTVMVSLFILLTVANVIPIMLGMFIFHKTGCSFMEMVLMIFSLIFFISAAFALRTRYLGVKEWKAKEMERQKIADDYNESLVLYLPENEVEAKVISISGDVVSVVIRDPDNPLKPLASGKVSLFDLRQSAMQEEERRVPIGTLLRAWYDRKRGVGFASTTISVLRQVGHKGLAARTKEDLPAVNPPTAELPAATVPMIFMVVLGMLFVLATLNVLR